MSEALLGAPGLQHQPYYAPCSLTVASTGCWKWQRVSTRWDLQAWELSLLLASGLGFPVWTAGTLLSRATPGQPACILPACGPSRSRLRAAPKAGAWGTVRIAPALP